MVFRHSVRFRLLSLGLGLLFTFSSLCQAQQISRWIGTDGNWSDPANWDNGVPNGFSFALIDLAAGEIVQDVEGLQLVGLELSSSTLNLVLDHGIIVDETLIWNIGKISGNSSLEFHGVGEVNGGDLESTFENYGSIAFGSNGDMVLLGSETGGTWINRSGSTATAPHGLLIGDFTATGPGEISVEADSSFSVGGASMQTVWDFQNQGILNLEAHTFFFEDFVQLPGAELILENGGVDFFQVSDLDGRVSGSGTIGNLMGPFEVEFEPGGRQIGVVNSFGGMVMAPDTVSNFQIGPNLTSDRLTNAGGPLQLDGTLNIEALPGVTPGVYTLFTFNNASSLQVDPIQFGEVPAGFSGQLVLSTQLKRVDLVIDTIDPVILGDVNIDGSVDLLDVNPMVALLSSGGFLVQADINGDGEVNLLDVPGFIELLSGN